MRYLLISMVCILFLGCKVTTVKNYSKSDITTTAVAKNLYFANSAIDYVYKTNVEVYGTNFSGILIIKKTALETHRMVFTSQFGSTFFDIELGKESYKINTIVKQLDRKIILNTLIRDFSLLVKEIAPVVEKYYNQEYEVLKNKQNTYSNYYFYEKKDVRLHKIVQTTRSKEKFDIIFNDITDDEIAKKITIDHKNIKLKIELNALRK